MRPAENEEGKIAFLVGVELSFLDEHLQYDVLNACEENENTLSYAQAVRMNKSYNAGELDCDVIDEIMCQPKANLREKVTIPLDRLQGKIPNSYTEQQQKDYMVKAVVDRRSGEHKHFSFNTGTDDFIQKAQIAIFLFVIFSRKLTAVAEIVGFINYNEVIITPINTAQIQAVL